MSLKTTIFNNKIIYKISQNELNMNNKLKFDGDMKSKLRKSSTEINYSNYIKSKGYKNNEKLDLKFSIIQIVLNILLLGIYFFYEISIFMIIVIINYTVIWAYSLWSISKSTFKIRRDKFFWHTLVLFIPFSAYIYLSYKKKLLVENNLVENNDEC